MTRWLLVTAIQAVALTLITWPLDKIFTFWQTVSIVFGIMILIVSFRNK